ncbi:MAG TPA: hypothetical protein VJM32_04155 [Candidatus Saccharimonadales bacterium]|nr:hypothetical protein [Candidatus Saccharimonadales bacterium]
MQRLVERGIAGTPASNLVAMAIWLYSMPRPVSQTDAILVLPGQGEDWRLNDAVAAWNNCPNARYLLVAGNYKGERTWFLPTIEILRERYGLTRTEGVLIHPHAHHTKEQSDWIIPTIQELGLTSISLFVSPYHLLRAFCCILKAFTRHDVPQIPMIPVPVLVSPTTPVPETGITGWDLVHGEVERILKYTEFGDVATPEELMSYLDWLFRQPIITNATSASMYT